MMRTKKQGKEQGLPTNAAFKWPDVQAFGLCPVCAKQNEPSKRGDEYYMVLHMLLQKGAASNGTLIIGTRIQCQLVCIDCLEGLVAGKELANSNHKVMESLIVRALC